MIFSNKSRQSNRSKTPVKVSSFSPFQPTHLQQSRKQYSKQQLTKQSLANMKYKSKDSMLILQSLQQIYFQLSFNQYDAFPIENIFAAKAKIADLCKFYKGQPICPKHQDLLNLYCQNDKQMICVSCVYKGNMEHKNHKIKSLQNVQKSLQYQTIRSQQKCKSHIDQLLQLRTEIQRMEKQISEQYTMISNYTCSIFQDCVSQLNRIKQQMEKKLSLAYRRTSTIISRYRQALQEMTSMVNFNMQKTISMKSLPKYLVFKTILNQSQLIQNLIEKFSQNRILMQQWKKSNKEFERILVKKKINNNKKIDHYIVTQF